MADITKQSSSLLVCGSFTTIYRNTAQCKLKVPKKRICHLAIQNKMRFATDALKFTFLFCLITGKTTHGFAPSSSVRAIPRTSSNYRNDQNGLVETEHKSWQDRVATREMKFLLDVQQRLPESFMKPFSLMVHYSLMPSIVTPILALLAWLVSLPKAASLICFVCAQDVINQAVKWAVQRPRPRWYDSEQLLSSSESESTKTTPKSTWETDFSFPSAHTQFFSGLAFCTPLLFGKTLTFPLVLLGTLVGSIIGLTRNYLGVHWPTDTAFGFLLGGVLGMLWGRYDPYKWLLEASSPALSIGVATGTTLALLSLLMIVRRMVPPVSDRTHNQWCINVLKGQTNTNTDWPLAQLPRGSRRLRTKLSVMSTIWCTLASTAFLCPSCELPSSMILLLEESSLRLHHRFVRAIVGLTGLMGTAMLIKQSALVRYLLSSRRWKPKFTKMLWKSFAYAGVCAWTFVLTQLVTYRLLGVC